MCKYKAKRGTKWKGEEEKMILLSVWQVDLMHLKVFSAHQWFIRRLQIKCFALELRWMESKYGFRREKFMSSLFYANEIALNAVCCTVYVGTRKSPTDVHDNHTDVSLRNRMQAWVLTLEHALASTWTFRFILETAWFICLFFLCDFEALLTVCYLVMTVSPLHDNMRFYVYQYRHVLWPLSDRALLFNDNFQKWKFWLWPMWTIWSACVFKMTVNSHRMSTEISF